MCNAFFTLSHAGMITQNANKTRARRTKFMVFSAKKQSANPLAVCGLESAALSGSPTGFGYFCPSKSINKLNYNLSFFNRAYHNALNKILLYERVNDYDRNGCEHDTSGL